MTQNMNSVENSVHSELNEQVKSSEQINKNNPDFNLEDGPLFRATIKEYEGQTAILKGYIKRILKAAIATFEAKNNLLEQDKLFMEALREAPFAEPLFKHYLDGTWYRLHEQQERLALNMKNFLIGPLQKLYDMDIKTIDTKRKQFEDCSKEYYSNLSKYLSIKTPNSTNPINSTNNNSNNNNTNIIPNTNMKEKRMIKVESEFMVKKSEFDLVRFDYYTFLVDLHGGKKNQEILYHLLNHHEKQYAYYQDVIKTLEPYKSGLDELATMIAVASREQKMVNQERDEKRKLLVSKYTVPEELSKSERRKSANILFSPPFLSPVSDPGIPVYLLQEEDNKFKGIRDLEQKDPDSLKNVGRKKEGFLFATAKPTKNNNVPGFDMSANVNWHKYWCVVSDGYLHEYSNWKKHLESHIEPINLKCATVREARNIDRRFCFEVITPNFKRMYQATSKEELNSWLATINNAISSLLNGSENTEVSKNEQLSKKPSGHWKHARSLSGALSGLAAAKDKYLKKRNNDKLFTTSPPPLPHQQKSSPGSPITSDSELLSELRKDMSNTICADCSAKNPEWCSLNLGILICIECSGIHRSLGTHISKVRSLNLDSQSFTSDIIHLLTLIGNATSNNIWEAKLLMGNHEIEINKPSPTDTREVKLKYIQAKYVDKALVDDSSGVDAMSVLYNAIEQDDIPKALYAIAIGANINEPFPSSDKVIPLLPEKKQPTIKLPVLDADGNEYTDRTMEVTLPTTNSRDALVVRYAIHLALLPINEKSHSFAMAELLFQNGADVYIKDASTGLLLADLIGLGNLVDDEAISYVNMKSNLRGQSPIIRAQSIPGFT